MANHLDFHEMSDAYEPTIYALANAMARGCKSAFLIGPPGTGKMMLARRIPTIMPALTAEQVDRLREIYALTRIDLKHIERPFRAPHHTISQAAMIGTPARPARAATQHDRTGKPYEIEVYPARERRPGEAELASFGVLMLDELTEFPRAVLEATASKLRDLGDAAPYVIATSNPCYCGWHDSAVRECTCTVQSVQRYRERLKLYLATLKIDQQLVMPASVGASDRRNGLRCAASATIARHTGLIPEVRE